jgi:hypothetical protein
MPSPLVIGDPEVMTPPGRPFWTAPEMWDPEKFHPTWTTGEACRTFLGIPKHALLMGLRRAHGVEGLPDVAPPRRAGGAERFAWRLYDIELIAHHLATRGSRTISPARLRKAITMVKTCAEIHEFI